MAVSVVAFNSTAEPDYIRSAKIIGEHFFVVDPTHVLIAFLHFAESKFIMTWLIGDRMELHPVIIIVVLIVGGELGGILIGVRQLRARYGFESATQIVQLFPAFPRKR